MSEFFIILLKNVAVWIFLSKGRRRRNRNKKNAFAEEKRVSEEAMHSAMDVYSLQQAERRLKKDGIYSLNKVPALLGSSNTNNILKIFYN